MTEEQFAHNREILRILEGKFLTFEHVKIFLNMQGYAWQGVYAENEDRNYGSFWHSVSKVTSLREIFVFLGERDNLAKTMKQYNGALVDNPHIKYLTVSPVELKLFVPKINEFNHDILIDEEYEPTFKFELEKDLTDKWIEFLMFNVPEYEMYIKSKIEQQKSQIPARIKSRRNLIAEKIKLLKKQQEQLLKQCKMEEEQDWKLLEGYNKLESFIMNIEKDNEKTTSI